ncbi:MAG: type VI secretion system tip protein TssI/VgrG [Polyangiaceae bacterium]
MSMKSALEQILPGSAKSAERAERDLYQFISRGKHERRLHVARFHGEERMNSPYEFDVEVLAPHEIDPLTTLEEQLLGNPGSLVMADKADGDRFVHGIVTGYEVLGSLNNQMVRVRLRVSARMSLLRMRQHSRIFQDETVPGVVARILKEWGLPHVFELVGNYAARTYLTQYQETDFDFLVRILATEGIFFYFRQGQADDGVDQVVFSDDALYRPIPGMKGKLQMRTGNFEIDEGDVVELGVRRKIRQTAARLGDYDFRHPHLPLRSLELANDPKGIFGELGAERTGTYLFGHDGEHEPGASARKRDENATRLLQALRADGLAVIGTSRSRKLLPGHSFGLEGHPLANLNRDWVVVAVTHDGHTPEYGGDNSEEVYANEFEAAAIETPLRIGAEARVRKVHGSQTAVVVGGAEGEVFTDAFGRVKVQFHWDLEGKRDEHSSCWIRVSQPWAGPGFGAQFLPRVGTEVVITFLDGDPDRPLVVGTVFNGTNPFPFGLPNQRTKSGFRTMSTPGGAGAGASELSFDDDQGKEVVLLKAQRDLSLEVGHDHKLTVTGNATMRFDGQLTENVTGTHAVTVAGGQTTLVTLQRTAQVLGDALEAVRGNADRRVSGDDNLRVEGTARGDLASVETFVRTDATHRVRGHMTAVVGEDAKPTSAAIHVEGTLSGYASKTTELIAEKGIVLRCGQSSLRIAPDRVEIISPRVLTSGDEIETNAEKRYTAVSKDGVVFKAKRLHAMGESSSLLLYQDADLGGNRVKFNCQLDEAAVVAKPKQLTKIQLMDENGAPASRRRFVVITSDGERSGVLNDKGEAELELDADGQIYFPDVDKPREA